MKRILAISGSLRTGSSNHAILKFLQYQTSNDTEFTLYNLLDCLPLFDPDKDKEAVDIAVSETRKMIMEADGVIICTPEYAFGPPGALKNMLDWLVSSGSLVDKPVMLVTASLGGEHAHASLLLTLGALSANIIQQSCFIISFVRSKVDSHGNVTDVETMSRLTEAFDTFRRTL